MERELHEVLDATRDRYRGPPKRDLPPITLAAGRLIVHLNTDLSDEYLASVATSVSGTSCTCMEGNVSVAREFLTKEDAVRGFLVRYINQLRCNLCGGFAFESTRDKKRLVLACRDCGHVKIY